MGGMTTLVSAQRHRERFDRIIAADCGPASTPAGAQQWSERITLAAEKGMAALADVTIPRWFPPDFVATKAPVLDKVRGMIVGTPFKGFAGCAQALSDYDMRPGLAGIDRPTLLLVGTKDATLAGIRAIKEAVKGAALVELEGPGTSPMSSSRRPSPAPCGISSTEPEASARRAGALLGRHCKARGRDIPDCQDAARMTEHSIKGRLWK